MKKCTCLYKAGCGRTLGDPPPPPRGGPRGAGRGAPPRRRQWLWTRSEPQRARVPPVPTLAGRHLADVRAAETQDLELVNS